MRGLLGALCVVLAGSVAQAQVENFAATPRIWGAQLSPDGSRLATGCSPRGLREICLFDLESGDRSIIPQPENATIIDFYWPSNDYVVYWISSYQTVAGQYARESGYNTIRAVSYGVETRSNSILLGRYSNVTGLGDITSSMIGHDDRVAMELTLAVDQSPGAGSRVGDRRSRETVAYEVSLEDGNMERVLETSRASAIQFVLDAEGEVLAEVRFDDGSGRYEIYSASGRNRSLIYTGTHLVSRPSIYGSTDEGRALAVYFPDQGTRRLALETGEISTYEIDGQVLSDVDPVRDPLTGEVVGFAYTDSLPRQMFLDAELAGLLAELQQILTEDSVTITAWNQARDKMIVEGRDIGVPANYYLLDLNTGGLGLLDTEYAFAEGTPTGERRRIRYTASDGLEIYAWLTLPQGAGADAGGFPLVVLPHGGPQSRDTGAFDWWPAYYASLGYAVLQPNFRGSAGRGPDFVEAGRGGFGTRMIDDIIEGAHHLQTEGIARAGSYCTAGGSYGGYAALMMALRDPENVACVVTFAGVTHPFAMLGGMGGTGYTRYWESYMGSRFQDRDYQDSISPVARAAEFSQPILVMHGTDDTTVPYVQMEMFETATAGRSNVRFMSLAGQDHYLASQEARRVLLEESARFLAEHLPAR